MAAPGEVITCLACSIFIHRKCLSASESASASASATASASSQRNELQICSVNHELWKERRKFAVPNTNIHPTHTRINNACIENNGVHVPVPAIGIESNQHNDNDNDPEKQQEALSEQHVSIANIQDTARMIHRTQITAHVWEIQATTWTPQTIMIMRQ